MARFGDEYNYRVQFDANGLGEIDRAAIGTRALSNELEQTATSAATAGRRMGHLNSIIFAGGNIIEDAQFGYRGIANNMTQMAMLITTRMHPAFALLAAAVPLVSMAFKDQINQFLAWTGVLDENIVKGMEKEKALNALGEATDTLTEATKRNTDAQRDQALAFLAAADAATTGARQAAQAVAQQFGGMNIRGALVKSLEEAFVASGRQLTDFNKALVEKQADAIISGLQSNTPRIRDWARNELMALAQVYEQTFKRFGVVFNDLVQQFNAPAAFGAPKMLDDMKAAQDRVIEREQRLKQAAEASKRAQDAAALAAKGRTKQAEDLATAIRKAEEAATKAAEAAKKGNVEAAKAAAQVAEEYERKAEAARQAAAAAEEAAKREIEAQREVRRAGQQLRLDAEAEKLAEAFRLPFQQAIDTTLRQAVASGFSVDQATEIARTGAFNQMRAAGVQDVRAADQAARALAEEQAQMVREQANAWEATFRVMLSNYQQGTQTARRAQYVAREMYRMQVLQGNNLRGGW